MWKNWKEQVSLFCKDLRLSDVGVGALVAIWFSYFFYRSFMAIPPMSVVGAGYVYLSVEERRRKRIRMQREQFKECILSVGASLRAGYAVSNAFLESMGDMVMLYGQHSDVVKELQQLELGLKNSEPLEELLTEWGKRSGLEDIKEFADVLAIGKRGGGHIQEMIDATSEMITGRMTLEEELETLLANKKLEQRVMNFMPFGIVLYLNWSNPGYFDMLYEGYVGRLIMTGCMLIYLFSYWLTGRILQKIYD